MKSAIRTTRFRAGSVLVVAMIVTITLSATVLVLCRTVRVESMAAANRAASVQADSIERGAEQYVIATILDQGQSVLDLSEDQFAAVPVGDGYFWVLRPDYDDDSLPVYGVVDECGKVSIDVDPNTANLRLLQIQRLPGMTDDIAASIVNWQVTDRSSVAGGVGSEYYGTLPEPYTAKNGRFETVEEALMIKDVTRQLLYGDGTAPPLGDRSSVSSSGTFVSDRQLARGIFDLVTVFSRGRDPRQGELRGRINVRTAPRAVLACIPQLDDSDIDKIIAGRDGSTAGDDRWLRQALGPKYAQIATQVSTVTSRYSADILAVTSNGRAFKRARIVIDTRQTTPRVYYRRDLTDRGWPMDPAVLASLRAGQGPGSAAIGMRSMGGGF